MSERKPNLAEVINVAIARGASSVRVSMPGRIEKVNKLGDEQTVDVKPLLHDHVDLEDGSEDSAEIDVICRVPLVVLGGGTHMITFPVAVGDECLLVFGDRSIDLWFERGGVVDPIDLRRHSLSDAVAIVGLRSKGNALSEFDTSRAVFGKQGGPRIAVSDSEIHLGVDHNEAAGDAIALASKVMDNFNALKDSFNQFVQTFGSHTHTVSTVGSPVAHSGITQPPLTPAQQAQSPSEVKSSKVKAK